MSNTRIAGLLLLCAFVLSLAGSSAWKAVRGKGSDRMSEQKSDNAQKDPCWFMTLNGPGWTQEMYLKRQQRELHGYPESIPLTEAVRILNEEKQCDPTLAPYAALSENEVIAAIVAGPGYGNWGEPWAKQKDALFKIAKDKMMPRGTLLVATAAPNVQDSPLRPAGDIKAKGISIALLLGLENSEHGQSLNQEQIFEIRRTYFSVDIVK